MQQSSTTKTDRRKEVRLGMFEKFYKTTFSKSGLEYTNFEIKRICNNFNGSQYVSVFKSEFLRPGGVYVELYRDLPGEDYVFSKERKLYKVPNTTIFAEEYEIDPTGQDKYKVSLDELREVDLTKLTNTSGTIGKTVYKANNTDSLEQDVPISEMTSRDIFMMMHMIPDSKHESINNLIKKYKK